MQIDRPFAAITPTLDGEVLRVLASTKGLPMTAPNIATVANTGSADGIRKALKRLTEQGILISDRVGHHDSYVLNDEHLLANALREIAWVKTRLLESLIAEFESWTVKPAYAALFGSAAYGKMAPDSDLDVFVVRRDEIEDENLEWQDQLEDLSHKFTLRTGNDTRIIELDESETRQRIKVEERFLQDIKHLGYPLYGEFPK